MKAIITILLSLVLCANAAAHEELELFALQMSHGINQKYILLLKVKDEEAQKIIACSIVQDTENLIALIEAEAPKSINSKETLLSLHDLAKKEKEHLLTNQIGVKYDCNHA